MLKRKLTKLALCTCLAMSVVSCQGFMVGDIKIEGQTPILIQDSAKQGQIEFKTLESGMQSGIKQKNNYVIQSEDEFATFWKEHTSNQTPAPLMPKIDFKKSTIIAVFIGETPANDKKVEITQIVDADKKVIVHAKINKLESMLTVVTYPYHIVTTAQKIEKPVDFNITGGGISGEEQNVLKFETIEIGTNSCIREPNNTVVKTKEEWASLYKKHIACKDIDSDVKCSDASGEKCIPSAPDVDFDKQMVVGVFLGNRPSSGYNVKITQILDQKDYIEVKATETTPDKDKMTLTVMTYPYHLIKLEKSKKEVRFSITKREIPPVEPTALPTLPPVQPVKYETVQAGADSCINEQVNFVVDSKERWQEIYAKHVSCQPATFRCKCIPQAPDVDFENYLVLALFGGEKLNGCTPKIGIKEILETEKEVAVYINIPPQDDEIACFRMVKNPYFFAAIPKVKKPINFYYPTTTIEPVPTIAPTVIPTITPTIVPTIIPTLPPVQAEKLLTIRNLGIGSMSSIRDYKETVAYSQDDYNKLWIEHTGAVNNSITDFAAAVNPPPVDFNKEMVLGLFLGTRTSGGYAVKIDKVVFRPIVDTTAVGGGEIVVYATETEPGPNSMNIMILTSPYHIIAAERLLVGIPIKFVLTKTIR